MSETTKTRTRDEIQAEIIAGTLALPESPLVGDKVAAIGTVVGYEVRSDREGDEPIAVVVQFDNDFDDTTSMNIPALIPAADLIPREEHERAVEEAGGKLTSLDANTAVKYLASEYDLDTGHMDTAEPRWYPFDHNGHIYEVVVRRKAAAASQPTAAAPKGVVEELRAIARKYAIAFMDWNPNDKASREQCQCADKDLNAALSRITELPEPSEWARAIVNEKQFIALEGLSRQQMLDRAAALIERAALRAKEGE